MTTITAGLAEQQQARSATRNACQSTVGRVSDWPAAGVRCVVTCSEKCGIMITACRRAAPHGRVQPPGHGGRKARRTEETGRPRPIQGSTGCETEVAAELTDLASANAVAIGAGHAFVILLRDGFPINVLNPIKAVPEVCTIFCATANPVDVLVAVTDRGRGIVGVIDGQPPVGVETDADVADRHRLLRDIGTKSDYRWISRR
jgi:hypothetical protein